MVAADEQIEMPVVSNPSEFDSNSGSRLERLIFNHRVWVVWVCAAITLLLGWQATKLEINASFAKMIPQSHPYILNYFENKAALGGMENSIRVVVENTQGDIFDKRYLLTLQKVTDDLMVMKGVDRSWTRGLWTPNVRWSEVTEVGYAGGPVMPDNWTGSEASMAQLQANILRSGVIGSYVASNLRSSMIVVPLIERDPATGALLDYGKLSRELEARVRSQEVPGVKIHIVGFAKVVGDLIDGLSEVVVFFGVSALIAAVCVFVYTRCVRSTALLVFSAVLGVVWLLGVMRVTGHALDPYSILVPFLIFAIGLSHGSQKMNGIMQDVGRGTHKYVAARYTFRRLFVAGLTALLTNVFGFAVLMVIDIPAIKEMAIVTSMGVCILIFTKLVLVPVLLSYTGVGAKAAQRSVRESAETGGFAPRFWNYLVSFTQRRQAIRALALAVVVGAGGFAVSTHLKTGDLDAGEPSLRPDSRYNRDAAFVTQNYALSSDQFVVMLKTPPGDCMKFQTLVEADRLGQTLRQVEGVQTTATAADAVRVYLSGFYEGNPKWMTISRNPSNLNVAFESVMNDRPELVERDCAVTPLIAYLADHKAETLQRVSRAVEAFAESHGTDDRRFLLAAGSAGIEAVTNIVVHDANIKMLVLVYASVVVLCFLTFRSWRAVLVALVPLVITSVLCEALMVVLGIGIKVATLPVITLGVGVGVDYSLYLLSVQLARQRQGDTLAQAYRHALQFTGRVVALVGITMAAGVMTWVWSPIKFQSDMGILLTFMFLWNMVGALFMIPALSHFLLRTPADEAAASQPRAAGPSSRPPGSASAVLSADGLSR